jgi:acyl-CoA thioesterase
MPGRLKIYDGSQFVEITNLPQKQTTSFTTLSVAGTGSTLTGDQSSFNNRSWVRKLTVTPTNGSVNSYVIEFFHDGTFTDAKLEYKATASGTFIDNAGWFHEDEESAEELHYRITNNSLVSSTFTIALVSEVFA